MKKLLNIGCGGKFHKEWENIDLISVCEEVKAANLLDGIPYSDATFDFVYHSQLLEHIPQEKAEFFIGECFRVLRPGGVLRVATPDLENIAKEYIRLLELCNHLDGEPEEQLLLSYEWMKIEMYDQIVRNYPGGRMATFVKSIKFDENPYIANRVGKHMVDFWTKVEENRSARVRSIIASMVGRLFFLLGRNSWFVMFRSFATHMLPRNSLLRIGLFRTGGEVHYVMYDRFSLSRLLKQSGFCDVRLLKVGESSMQDFSSYELEVKNGIPYDSSSLYVESRRAN